MLCLTLSIVLLIYHKAYDFDDLEWGTVLSKAGRHEKDPIELVWRPPQDKA